MEPALQELYAEGSPEDEVAVIVRLSDSTTLPPGIRIIAQFGPIVTCRLMRADIPRVRNLVSSMKRPRLYAGEHGGRGSQADVADLEPGEELIEQEVEPTDQRRPSGNQPTGKGVVLAHIDWGCDIRHPDFRHADGRTRLLALWDQSAPVNPQQPNRYGYGRIYDAADVNRALQSPDPFAALNYDPGTASHGSHTLGISGGNGASGGPSGVAPEADLVFVHLSTATPQGPALLGDSVALLESFDFILRVAGSRPVVVSMSLGRHSGEHDHLPLTVQGMDHFLLAAPGRAIVQSCGNYYNKEIHAQGILRPGQSRTLRFVTDHAQRNANELDLWYPGTDRFSVQLRAPGRSSASVVEAGGSAPVLLDGKNVGTMYHRLCDPNNGDNEITIFLYPSAPAGEWSLTLTGEDVADGRFHAWMERDATCPSCQAHFTPDCSNPTRTIGTIANGLRTIAVGAYDGHREERPLAPFSSSGPTRDGRVKPDLVAPGVRILSARSRARGADPDAPLLTRMSGTSMAAPHVAGVVACMFQAAGRPLFIEETRRLLLTTTEAPGETDLASRLRFGSGYLNFEAAIAAAGGATSALAAPVRRTAATAVRASPPAGGESAIAARTPTEMEIRTAEPDRGAAMRDEESAVEDIASDKRNGRRDTRRSAPREPAALPFQFQIPLTGGSPALSVPVGGSASPFAFAIPLGGTPPPAPVAPPPSSPAAPAEPAAAPAATTGADQPVAVATDVPLYAPPESDEHAEADYGESVKSAAERIALSGGGRWSSSRVLSAVLSGREGDTEAETERVETFAAGLRLPSATTLFNAFVFPDSALPQRAGLRPALRERYEQRFRLIAGPGQNIANVILQPGDLLVRIARGEGWGHIAVIASPERVRAAELARAQLRGEGYPRLLPGGYVQVIEISPRTRSIDDRFARRLTDSSDVLLPDTLVVRPLPARLPGESGEAADAPAAATPAPSGAPGRPVLRPGMAHAAVRELQEKLNRVHGDLEALALPGLDGCPLNVSGRFDNPTAQAVAAFQRQVFDDPGKWDGVVGPETWAQLDLLAGGAPARTEASGTSVAEADGSGSGSAVAPAPAVTASIVAANAVVMVRKSYTRPARTLVTLSAGPFTGTGTLRRSKANIDFYTAPTGGSRITFDGRDNAFSSARLSAGVQLYAEGVSASSALNDVSLTLALRSATGPVGTPATVQLTAVEVTLEIHRSRTSAAAAPPPLSARDKINVGRFLQVQDATNTASRAMLVISPPQPAGFSGTLVLTPMDARVSLFAREDPGAPGSDAPLPTPHRISTSTIPASGLQVFVQGRSASGALRDTGVQLGIEGVDPTNGDRVVITTVAFTRIRATIKPTPANTARTGFPAPLPHTFDTTGLSEDFSVTAPLVLIRNAQPDIELEATCAPAGLPVRWAVTRNAADHTSLGRATDLPRLTPNPADATKARLNANEKGAFRVRAYVEASGASGFQPGEPSIPLNLILANVTVVADNSIANAGGTPPGSVTINATPAGVSIANGAWPASAPGAALTAGDLAAAGMTMELVADVTGGGADGLLGLDRVFCGLVNNLHSAVIEATYHFTAPSPGDVHLRNVYVSNGGSATASLGSKPLFRAGDPAPTAFRWPLLDSGRTPAGAGGETATMGRSGPHSSAPRPVGQRWTIRCIDSPSRGFPSAHPLNPAAVLRRVRYHQEFIANFCFWTNVNRSRAATGHPADRVYSVLRIVPWEIDGEWNLTFSGAAPPTVTVVRTHRIRAANASRSTVQPVGRAQDHGVETRPPSGITQAFAWDART